MAKKARESSPLQTNIFEQKMGDERKQGQRILISQVITVRELLENTRREPEESYGAETKIQRPLNKKHCEAIAKYLKETPQYVIGPIVFTAEHSEITPNGEIKGEITILDGQHRVQALHLAVDELRSNNSQEANVKRARLEGVDIPLIYLENFGEVDRAQIFVDLNRGKPIQPSELDYLDSRNSEVNIVRDALEKVKWAKENTNMRGRSLKNRPEIWTMNGLVGILRRREGSLSGKKLEQWKTEEGKETTIEKLVKFLEWLPECREEYSRLATVENDRNRTDYEKSQSYVYEQKFLLLLGMVYHHAEYRGEGSMKRVTEIVRGMNLQRDNPNNWLKERGLANEVGGMKAANNRAYRETAEEITREDELNEKE